MKLAAFAAAVFLLAPGAPARAQEPPLQNPVSVPGAPWAFWGFVVNAPDAPDLVSQFKALTGTALGRKLPGLYHSWAFTVAAEKLDHAMSGADELLAYMVERRGEKTNPARFRILEIREHKAGHHDHWCTRYAMLGEDLSEPAPVPVMLSGMTCVHPAQRDYVVDVSYSERAGSGGISSELRETGEKFLSSLRFIPLPDRAEILDALAAAKAGKGLTALAMLKPLVERNDTQAAMVAGEILLRGYGAPRDAEAARRMLEIAAKDGHASALYNLGVIYETAPPAQRFVLEALKWFRLAADQRHNQAQLNLAILYDRGDGVPRDPAEAEKWGRFAANNGNQRAQQLLRGR